MARWLAFLLLLTAFGCANTNEAPPLGPQPESWWAGARCHPLCDLEQRFPFPEEEVREPKRVELEEEGPNASR